MKLINNKELEKSSIVANSLMNRERNLTGSNSYSRDLSFDVINYLRDKLLSQKKVAWLDICCGRGKALIEAAKLLSVESENKEIKVVGIDLVNAFERHSIKEQWLELKETSISSWNADQEFDLITCVHGLHYIGDKLETIRKVSSWLADGGIFIANLDLKNLKFENGKNAGRNIISNIKKLGVEYDSRKRLLICKGKKILNLPYDYIGADEQAGPNYTGQPAVDSYYGEKV